NLDHGFELRADGFARECQTDEVGMLLARVGRSEYGTMIPLRGVFSRDDAWMATGDLFRRDADGDFWRVDHQGDVVRTAAGPVYTGPIRDALGDLPAVDIAVAYGVVPEGESTPVALAAVTLRHGHDLPDRELTGALSALPENERPAYVHVVKSIPVTTWYRPLTASLRKAGIPKPGPRHQVWKLEPKTGRYTRLKAQRSAKTGETAAQPA